MAKFRHIVNVVPLTRVKLSGPQIFTYLVPIKLQGSVRLGQRVLIPFGPRTIEGVTSSVEMTKLELETQSLKELKKIVDQVPAMSGQNLKLANFLSAYYVSPLGLVMKSFLPKFSKNPVEPSFPNYEVSDPDFVLTEDQRVAINQITKALDTPEIILLHGVTGSGKTEVYMQVIQSLIKKGQQVILLVPEISLTPQAIERFARRFGMDKIAVLHSRMKPAERYFTWQKIRDGEKQIIIGPRSAIFAPVTNLALVILDEEHDSSYKQFDQSPKYHARTASKALIKLWNCPLVLGDATPSIESFSEALTKNSILTLPHRIKADVTMPSVQIIDMKREILGGNFSVFSEQMKAQILLNLKQQKQIILFINRRGSATVVLCRDCGFVLICKNCSSALVWHESSKKLLCHHCDRQEEIPVNCPKCKSHRIKQFGAGTQKIESELYKFLNKNLNKNELPKVVRMDKDTTRKSGSMEKIYQDWTKGKIQILIGTQMISKGWDVRNVGLVGIIAADTSLHLPDYRSNERTFQLLTQVAGRTGRGSETGIVVLQTYSPENYAIKAVKQHSYLRFFKNEIKERKKFNYPPFAKLIKLRVDSSSEKKASELARNLMREILANKSKSMEVLGPSPSFMPRLRGKYRFQIVVKIPYNEVVDLYDFFKDFKTKFDVDVDPESLL